MADVKLLKKLKKIKRFTFSEALEAGLNQRTIDTLLNQGLLEKVSWGVYQIKKEALKEDTAFSIACKVAGKPSAICLWSALIHYGLSDEIEDKTWVMVPDSVRRRDRNLRLVRLNSPQWEIGIDKLDDYWITNIERTLVDCLAHPRFVSPIAASHSLRRAVQEGKTNSQKLVKMASELGCLKKILPRLEAYIE